MSRVDRDDDLLERSRPDAARPDLRTRLRTGPVSDDAVHDASSVVTEQVTNATLDRIVSSQSPRGVDPGTILARGGAVVLTALVQDALVESPAEARAREQREAEARRIAEQQRIEEQRRLEQAATEALVRELEKGTPGITQKYADLVRAEAAGDQARVNALQREIGEAVQRNGAAAMEAVARQNPTLAPHVEAAFSAASEQYGQKLNADIMRTVEQTQAAVQAEQAQQNTQRREQLRHQARTDLHDAGAESLDPNNLGSVLDRHSLNRRLDDRIRRLKEEGYFNGMSPEEERQESTRLKRELAQVFVDRYNERWNEEYAKKNWFQRRGIDISYGISSIGDAVSWLGEQAVAGLEAAGRGLESARKFVSSYVSDPSFRERINNSVISGLSSAYNSVCNFCTSCKNWVVENCTLANLQKLGQFALDVVTAPTRFGLMAVNALATDWRGALKSAWGGLCSVGEFAKGVCDSLGVTDMAVGLWKMATAPAAFVSALAQGKGLGEAFNALTSSYIDGVCKLGQGAFRAVVECTGLADLGRACYFGFKLVQNYMQTGNWDKELLMEFGMNLAAAALSIGTLVATAGTGVAAVGAVKGIVMAGAKKLATEGVKACCKEAAEQIGKKCVAALGKQAMEKLGKEAGEAAAKETLHKLEKAVGKETLEKVQKELAQNGAKAAGELLQKEVGAVAKQLAKEEAEKVVDKQVRQALKDSLDKLISGEVKDLAEALSKNNLDALAKSLGKSPDEVAKMFGKFQRSAMAHHVGTGALDDVMKKELTDRISKQITDHLIKGEGKVLCEAFEKSFKETMERGLREAAEKAETNLGKALKVLKEADKEAFEKAVKGISDDAAKAAREAFEKSLEKVVREVVEEAVEKGLKEARRGRRHGRRGAADDDELLVAVPAGRKDDPSVRGDGTAPDPMNGNAAAKGWDIREFDNSWKTFAQILEAAERDAAPRKRTVGGETGTTDTTVPSEKATTVVKGGSNSNTPTTAA